jgi:hypothetical protein
MVWYAMQRLDVKNPEDGRLPLETAQEDGHEKAYLCLKAWAWQQEKDRQESMGKHGRRGSAAIRIAMDARMRSGTRAAAATRTGTGTGRPDSTTTSHQQLPQDDDGEEAEELFCQPAQAPAQAGTVVQEVAAAEAEPHNDEDEDEDDDDDSDEDEEEEEEEEEGEDENEIEVVAEPDASGTAADGDGNDQENAAVATDTQQQPPPPATPPAAVGTRTSTAPQVGASWGDLVFGFMEQAVFTPLDAHGKGSMSFEHLHRAISRSAQLAKFVQSGAFPGQGQLDLGRNDWAALYADYYEIGRRLRQETGMRGPLLTMGGPTATSQANELLGLPTLHAFETEVTVARRDPMDDIEADHKVARKPRTTWRDQWHARQAAWRRRIRADEDKYDTEVKRCVRARTCTPRARMI